MKKSILACVSCALVIWTANGAVAQPALEELENRLNRLLDPAKRPSTPPDPSAAEAEPGYLGMFADNVATGGAIVTSVERGGPAEAAGFRTRDVVTSANGTAIRSIDDLSRVLDRLNAGDNVEFQVLRGGRTEVLSVKLARRPVGSSPATSGGPSSALPSPAPADAYRTSARPSLGVRILPVNEETRLRFGLAVRRGAVVDSVRSGGPVHRAGLPVGAVIVSIDGRRVDSPDDLVGYIRTTRVGQSVELVFYRGERIERLDVEMAASEGASSSSPAPPPSAVVDPPLARSPIFGEDRPALRAIEGVIDRLVAPSAPIARPAPALPGGESMELRGQVETLSRQVELLQQRIAELERRLAASGDR